MIKQINHISNFLLLFCCLQACTNLDQVSSGNKYFQYYLSYIHIHNPRVVFFHAKDGSLDEPMLNFVCPDSAVKYCTDSNWINREDVYILNTRSYEQEQDAFPASGNWLYKRKPWDYGYYPWYNIQSINDTISIGRLYFDKDLTFILSLHTTSYEWYDPRKPEGEPISEKWDQMDAILFANTYRLAVRPYYSKSQIKKIKESFK